MSSHPDVAERFRYLLDAIELDRAGFVAAVDGAVSEQTLYSLLNGHRRPSRALAVLIERTWGFRADYLLNGEGAAWSALETTEADQPDQLAVLEVLSRSPELARTLRRDLDDAVLWSDLWQRARAMLEGMEEVSTKLPTPEFAELARDAFTECVWLSDRFEELVTRKLRRRGVHLVNAFLHHFEDSLAASETKFTAALQAAGDAREKDLRQTEESLRQQLRDHVSTPSPLDVRLAEQSATARALGGLEQAVLAALQRQDA